MDSPFSPMPPQQSSAPAPSVQIVHSSSEIGQAVRQKRKQQRMTQAQLAKAAQVGNRFISELENGKPSLQFDKVMCVLHYLQISLYLR